MSTIKSGYTRLLDFKHGRVDMTHGSGGHAMAQLIEELFVAAFDPDLAPSAQEARLRWWQAVDMKLLCAAQRFLTIKVKS